MLIGTVLQSNKKANEEKIKLVQDTDTDVPVTTAKAVLSPIELDFTASGNFEALHDLSFLSEASGRITELLVDEGDRVTKGQTLLRIDDELLRAEAEAAKANYDKMVSDRNRLNNAFENGGITRQQLDDINLGVTSAEARLIAANRKLRDSQVKSPISGIINKRYVEVGTYLSVANKLFDIIDVSTLKLRISVPEAQVVHLREKDTLTVTCPALPGVKLTGAISFIGQKADNTLNFPVELRIQNSAQSPVKAGMYGTVWFRFDNSGEGLLIPRSAFVGSVSNGKIFVLEGEEVKSRTVVPGRITGENVEVVSGLNAGETVVTSGQINLSEGTRVSVQEKQK